MSIHQSEWCFSYQFLTCGLVFPQYHWYIQVSIILFSIADLCQCIFKDLVKGFHCSICLRMIWCTLLIMKLKFLGHSLNSIVNEVSALVTHQNPLETKCSDHLLEQEVCCCIYTAIFYWNYFHPYFQVFHRSDNVPHS
jgi:hypothetical protein